MAASFASFCHRFPLNLGTKSHARALPRFSNQVRLGNRAFCSQRKLDTVSHRAERIADHCVMADHALSKNLVVPFPMNYYSTILRNDL